MKLSRSVTVHQYRELEIAGDRIALGRFICERFDERYFQPAFAPLPKQRHGFTQIAIGCLMVETLEAFYQGRESTNRVCKQMFRDFFNRVPSFHAFRSDDDWFFYHVRCGVLHQAEVRGGWRIWRTGALVDLELRSINASRFLRQAREAVGEYARALKVDDELWVRFRAKMDSICRNCERRN